VAPPAGQIRPWRYLASFVGIVVVLYGLVFFTGGGDPRPKLGIDLQGGTRVTLTPRTETGQEPPREQLLRAKQIIETRVNGQGVSGAEVVLDGSQIIITVPGAEGERAKDLGQTARLTFRPVIDFVSVQPPSPEVQPAPGAPSAPQPAPQPEPQPQPQGAPAPGAPVVDAPAGAITPVAATGSLDGPLAQQPPSPGPTPAPPPETAPPAETAPAPAPANPELAAEIEQAKKVRQSTDPAVQQVALQTLNCAAPDPLQGYDDPALPLVACNQDGTEKYLLGPAFLDGTQIADANSGTDQSGIGYVVNLTFKPDGSRIWGEYTSTHVGESAAFVLDGDVVSAPRINEPIFGGNTQISGQFSQEEARDLAGVLKYGSLPLSFEASNAETVSATLGLASLQASLIAGGIGLALVLIYCLFYYRVLGVLTVLSLVLSGVIVYAVLVLLGRWIGFTLDLAGVAGLIVAIGITADSFVVYFERLKDEVRDGRSFRSAVPRGWVRARRTILTADAVSFLAAAVLYILAVGQVKGFAFTLGMSTVLDLVVVFLVTYPLIVLAAKSRVFGSPAWSGLGAVARIGAERRQQQGRPQPGRTTTAGTGAR
jgi:preprotein translocase subunit SecD